MDIETEVSGSSPPHAVRRVPRRRLAAAFLPRRRAAGSTVRPDQKGTRRAAGQSPCGPCAYGVFRFFWCKFLEENLTISEY